MSSNKGGTNIKIPSGVWLVVIFITAIIVVIWLASIFQSPPSPEPSLAKLQMLGSSFSGYSTFRYPPFQDKLEKVEIELSYEDKVEQQEVIRRFNQGEADLIAMTLDQFLRQKLDGKIVGLIDRSVGADGAVLNTKRYPEVTEFEQLRSPAEQKKGKGQPLIVYAADSPSEFFLVVLIKNSYDGLNISFEDLKVSSDREAWKRLQVKSDVALAILREPYLTIAQQKGYIKVDFSTKNEPTRIIDVIVASNSLLQNQPETLSQLLTAYYERIYNLILDELDKPESANSLMQYQIFSDNEVSLEAAAEVGKGIHFFTAIEANYWLTEGELEKQIETIANLLSQAGKLDRKPQNPQDLFTAQYIADAVTYTKKSCEDLEDLPRYEKFKTRACYPTPPLPSRYGGESD